mmetsp:Transcript_28948/g.56577  ORF Transcript_28948/g.56577 Transcript_28948/m.56577 type:complete len:234 (+) Transcript_28948:256-957(+)|eukprot:CAMPEP_0173378464 /NCGR_PEP_ID=MMETSP1356-20130122/1614_1 /TAXON_ID=77927 ORGANISM="Hemiselmis virescens, Strain PCC157" /NCGR_SAMPLE_ID=MMETSP1356 /ASSEMBLY_ACC=CAM_ASM_000847 /LENGTH=233 /DNA_ID=CAMNT_0014331537 /DNA_START=235 /DNA_END=936 /DNA_ORIENTATION=+
MAHHLSAALTKLTPEQQCEYVVAFNTIDTSGDELLQKEEISAALVECGEHLTVAELDKMLADVGYKPQFDADGQEVGGMNLDQFIEMMAVHATADSNIAGMGRKNFNSKQFHNKRMLEMANRNSFKHKPSMDGADKMDAFLNAEEKCCRCHHTFTEDENSDDACAYHPMPGRSEGGRTRNDLEEVTFKCCGRVQKGTRPIVVEAEPCMKGRHMTREALNKLEAEAEVQKGVLG